MSGDERLEDMRKKRLLELQQRLSQEKQRVQMQQQVEMQKQALIRQILSSDARQRLTNLKMVKPEFGAQIELQLMQLAQAGRLKIPVTGEQLKEILGQLRSQRKNIKIRRK